MFQVWGECMVNQTKRIVYEFVNFGSCEKMVKKCSLKCFYFKKIAQMHERFINQKSKNSSGPKKKKGINTLISNEQNKHIEMLPIYNWVQVQRQEPKTMSNSGENYELFYICFFLTF